MNKIRSRLLLLVGCAFSSQCIAGAIIVSKDSPLGPVDAETAKRIFLGRDPTIAGGQALVVVFQHDPAIREGFERSVLTKTDPEVNAYWAKQIFTGRAAPPKEVANDKGALSIIEANPFAIGFVSDAGVDSTVKVIFRY